MKMPAGRFHGAIVKLRRAKKLSPHAAAFALAGAEAGRTSYRAFQGVIERCQVLVDGLADKLSGAETAGIVDFWHLRNPASGAQDGESYIPTKSASFAVLMKRLDIDHADYSFFDFGAGKGRVALMASRLPFQKVVGIEYSAQLVAIAEKNLRTQGAASDRVQIAHADASTFELPASNSVYYFYNPFGRETMRNVVRNIERALTKGRFKCVVAYLRPEHADLFAETGLFEEIASGVVGNENFKIYRSTN